MDRTYFVDFDLIQIFFVLMASLIDGIDEFLLDIFSYFYLAFYASTDYLFFCAQHIYHF